MEYKRYAKRNINFLDPEGYNVFTIVFDASCLNENEINIELQEGNKLKVSFKHEFRETGDISFSRDCTYVYTLPENVQSTNLAAYWFEDDFLVIKERGATEIVFKSDEGDSDEKDSDEILHVSAATDIEATPNGSSARNVKQAWQFTGSSRNNKEMIQDRLSPISSNQNKETVQDKPSPISSSSSEEMVKQERQSPIPSSNSKNMVKQERQSTISPIESKEMVVDERIPKCKSQISTRKTEEIDMQEMKSEITSSERKIISSSVNEKMATKNRNSMNTSNQRCKRLVQDPELTIGMNKKIQEHKSVDRTSRVQANSRLIPIKDRNLFTGIFSIDDLKAAMEDIGRRIKYVNEFLDMHGSWFRKSS